MLLRAAETVPPDLRAALRYRTAPDLLHDPRGRTVRCTPRRRTVELPDLAGHRLFGKHFRGAGARREWRGLHWLRAHGFDAPEPLYVAHAHGHSAILLRALDGRPLDAVLHARPDALEALLAPLATLARRLHDLRHFHRDLYLNHLFLEPHRTAPRLALIDAERLFRSRLRDRRWRIKDLAALWSSTPASTPPALLDTLLGHYCAPAAPSPALRDAVRTKATRIRTHTPKYG